LWSGPSNQTVETNSAGLFSTDVGPVTPESLFTVNPEIYLQVSVHDGTAFKDLLPRQKLSSVPYSFYAGTAESIVDNSISTSKIQNKAVTEQKLADHSVGTTTVDAHILDRLLPSGMVAMFARECPAGWDPYTQMNNRFPRGAETYENISGGSDTISGLVIVSSGSHTPIADSHSHSMAGHQHVEGGGFQLDNTGVYWSPTKPSDAFFGTRKIVPLPGNRVDINQRQYGGILNSSHDIDGILTSGPTSDVTSSATPLISPIPDHNHPIVANGPWTPPYHEIVFCEKR